MDLVQYICIQQPIATRIFNSQQQHFRTLLTQVKYGAMITESGCSMKWAWRVAESELCVFKANDLKNQQRRRLRSQMTC